MREAHRRSPRPAGDPNPFEAFLLVACIMQGLSVVSGASRPASMAAVPTLLTFVWGALLLVGGPVALVGLFWPGDPMTGVEIKRPGLLACGFATLAYGAALVPLGGPAMIAAISNLAFALACFWRTRQVTRRVRDLRKSLVEARTPRRR